MRQNSLKVFAPGILATMALVLVVGAAAPMTMEKKPKS